MKSYESYEKNFIGYVLRKTKCCNVKNELFEKTGPQVKNHNFLYFMTISHSYSRNIKSELKSG